MDHLKFVISSFLIPIVVIAIVIVTETQSESFLVGSGEFCGKDADNNFTATPCNETEFCLNAKCLCKYGPTYQFYDRKRGICRSHLFGPCEVGGIKDQCLDNAVCGIQSRTGLLVCQCGPGFVETEAEATKAKSKEIQPKCTPAPTAAAALVEEIYGTKCEYSLTHQPCDPKAGLYCRENICNCEYEMEIFVRKKSKCLTRVGGICSSDEDCDSGNCYRVSAAAVKKPKGRCECLRNWETTAQRTCKSDL